MSNAFHGIKTSEELTKIQIRAAEYAKNKKELFDNIYNFLNKKFRNRPPNFNEKKFEELKKEFYIKGNWIELNPFLRAKFLVSNFNNKKIRNFLLPRLLGLNSFIILKNFKSIIS